MYYTYKVETHSGEKTEITVKANSESEARNRMSDYDVSRGELHYSRLISVSDNGTEKYYRKKQNGESLGLLIGLMGAALCNQQVSMSGGKNLRTNEIVKKVVTDEEVLRLLTK